MSAGLRAAAAGDGHVVLIVRRTESRVLRHPIDALALDTPIGVNVVSGTQWSGAYPLHRGLAILAIDRIHPRLGFPLDI